MVLEDEKDDPRSRSWLRAPGWHGGCFLTGAGGHMAKNDGATVTLGLRRAVTKIQRDGQRTLGRMERELRQLVRRTQADLTTDTSALRRDVVARLRLAEREIGRRVGTVEAAVRTRLGIGAAEDVAKLAQRIAGIERRLGDVERRMTELADQLHDQLPSEQG
jgi:hypothetical protein